MGLETGTYISDLVTTNPANGDDLEKADDHFRLIKSTIKTTFPNITGAVTPTHTELNYVDGVTSAIQTQLDAKAATAGPTFTGTVVLPSTTSIGSVSSTEIGYLDNVTSAIQTQLDDKAPTASPTFTGTVVLPSTTSIGSVSSTEIGYLDNVTSAIQTQLDAKAPLASPTFTGTPSAPTPSANDNSTKIATTAYVDAKSSLTSGTVTDASGGGTSIDYTSIPAGTKRIHVSLSNVSVNASAILILRIGDSGGIETSGHEGASLYTTGTSATTSDDGSGSLNGFRLGSNVASSDSVTGHATLTLIDPAQYLWVCTCMIYHKNSPAMVMFSGRKALSAELDRIRITTTGGTATFDSGYVNILYE